MVTTSRNVLLQDPENQPDEGEFVEFRLTYDGPLLSTQRPPEGAQRDPRAQHKHSIRQVFHRQLRRLWEITPFLNTGERSGPSLRLLEGSAQAPALTRESLAEKHQMFGFRFVPLVTGPLNVMCGLDILYLRPSRPGGLYTAGDIDNRLKTLLDALRVPTPNEGYERFIPMAGEQPFYCLLEDDRLVTKVSVEADQLLDLPNEDPNAARLVITVRLRPYELNLWNLPFGAAGPGEARKQQP